MNTMGREIQKKKNRSSLPRIKQRPKSKKKLVLNPIVAANWYLISLPQSRTFPPADRTQHRDKKQTLVQNYRRIGLSSRLNAPTGGIEKHSSTFPKSSPLADLRPTDHDRLSIKPALSSAVVAQEIRIERDPETGKILRVLDEPTIAANPLDDPLNALEDNGADEDEWKGFDDSHIILGHRGSRPSTSQVVHELETEASGGLKKPPRRQSQREEEWVGRLVEAHGQDHDAMFRDRRLNPMQQSVGELRRRITKYLTSRHK